MKSQSSSCFSRASKQKVFVLSFDEARVFLAFHINRLLLSFRWRSGDTASFLTEVERFRLQILEKIAMIGFRRHDARKILCVSENTFDLLRVSDVLHPVRTSSPLYIYCFSDLFFSLVDRQGQDFLSGALPRLFLALRASVQTETEVVNVAALERLLSLFFPVFCSPQESGAKLGLSRKKIIRLMDLQVLPAYSISHGKSHKWVRERVFLGDLRIEWNCHQAPFLGSPTRIGDTL